MNFLFVLLEAPAAEAPGMLDSLTSMWPILAIIVVFYLFFIRPQMKKSKDQRKFREALKKGDKVITIGGLHGKILEVGEKTITLDVGNQSKMVFEKSAIAADPSAQIGAK